MSTFWVVVTTVFFVTLIVGVINGHTDIGIGLWVAGAWCNGYWAAESKRGKG